MFLDISFLGAAAYQKDGYARIYSKLRKERRRKSVCMDEPLFISHDKYGQHPHHYDKSQAKLDITFRYYVNNQDSSCYYGNNQDSSCYYGNDQEGSREARKNSHNRLNESFKITNIQKHYIKHYTRRHTAGQGHANRVSVKVNGKHVTLCRGKISYIKETSPCMLLQIVHYPKQIEIWALY